MCSRVSVYSVDRHSRVLLCRLLSRMVLVHISENVDMLIYVMFSILSYIVALINHISVDCSQRVNA